MSYPRRGEIYWLNFDPATGAEMMAVHPCVVVQNDAGNLYSATTIVVAVTGNLRAARLPVAVLLPAGAGGLHKESVAHCGHIYSVDKGRLGALLGTLPPGLMAAINIALARSLTL